MGEVPDFDSPVPGFVQEWVAQLCEPDVLALLRAAGNSQVDVTLSVAKHGVRRPVVTVVAGHG